MDYCPESYLKSDERNSFFEIICQFDNLEGEDSHVDIYLIPLYRMVPFNHDTDGFLIAFKRDYLDEDDKEYALDVFKLFNLQGENTHLRIKKQNAETLF